MAEKEAEVLPAGEALEEAAVSRKTHPNRGKKSRVLGEGEGDYIVAQVIHGHESIPDGAMVAVPGATPERPFLQFEETAAALRWIQNDSTERLGNGKVIILKVCAIMDLGVEQVVQKRTIIMKQKIQVAGPTGEQEDA